MVAVDPSDLPELFRAVWISGENHGSYRELVSMLARRLSTPKLRRRLFSEDDWNYFEALPRRITIYRGAKWFCLRGRSWTLDRAIAEKFTDWMRYDRAMPAEYRAATVMERTVSKDSVLFYTMSGASRRSFLRGRRRAEWRQKKPSACAQPKWRTSKTGE